MVHLPAKRHGRGNENRIMPTSPTTRARYDVATQGLQAFAIINSDGTNVGRIVIRIKATSQGHCARAYVHVFGHPMHEGKASGGGYDMNGAALEDAIYAAWPAWPVHIRTRFEPVLSKLAGGSVDSSLAVMAGDWIAIRAV
jgi:hypothetical protein